MTIDASLGAVRFELPGTFSLKNWPFYVLLALLGSLPAAFLISDGRVLLGLAFFIGVPGVPVGLVLLFGWLGSLLVASVRRVHADGLVVSWRGRLEGWPYSELELESDQTLETDVGISNRALQVKHRATGRRLVVQSGVVGEPVVQVVADALG